jgi:hypothetical protein
MGYSSPSPRRLISPIAEIKIDRGVIIKVELVGTGDEYSMRLSIVLPPRDGRPTRPVYATLDVQAAIKLVGILQQCCKLCTIEGN